MEHIFSTSFGINFAKLTRVWLALISLTLKSTAYFFEPPCICSTWVLQWTSPLTISLGRVLIEVCRCDQRATAAMSRSVRCAVAGIFVRTDTATVLAFLGVSVAISVKCTQDNHRCSLGWCIDAIEWRMRWHLMLFGVWQWSSWYIQPQCAATSSQQTLMNASTITHQPTFGQTHETETLYVNVALISCRYVLASSDSISLIIRIGLD